jgi:hypothetical protein
LYQFFSFKRKKQPTTLEKNNLKSSFFQEIN